MRTIVDRNAPARLAVALLVLQLVACGRFGFGTDPHLDAATTLDAGGLDAAAVDATPTLDGLVADAATVDDATSGDSGPRPDAAFPPRVRHSPRTGPYNVCVIRMDGHVACAGTDTIGPGGQLGEGTGNRSPGPEMVSGLEDVVDIAIGAYTLCALEADGEVWCWAGNARGACGDGTTTDRDAPVRVLGIDDATSISGDGAHQCATRADGSVWCWGDCDLGQLGDGRSGDPSCFSTTPVQTIGVSDAISVTASSALTCALHATGTVSCWGERVYGSIGDGGPLGADGEVQATPALVSGLDSVVELDSRGTTSCARRDDGSVWCWGRNDVGQVGDGTMTHRAAPVRVVGIDDALSLDIGRSAACVVHPDGSTSCWGEGIYNARRDDILTPSSTPFRQRVLPNVREISVDQPTCAATDEGIYCWGEDRYGQFGLGLSASGQLSERPQSVVAVSGGDEIFVGPNGTCVIDAGAVQCFGANLYGMFGNGTDAAVRTGGAVMMLPAAATSVGLGYDFACALLVDGRVFCAGNNPYGQLGSPGGASSTPRAVTGLSTAVALAVGGQHACALLMGGNLKCWGRGYGGELGNGLRNFTATPADVIGVTGAVAVCAGNNHTCVALAGEHRCWGSNTQGQLGDGSVTMSSVAVVVQDLTIAGAPHCGASHTCVLSPTGELQCWGNGTHNLMVDGTENDALSAVSIPGMPGLLGVALGQYHTCVIHPDRTVSCWGVSDAGQGGNHRNDNNRIPTLVAGLVDVVDLKSRGNSVCAEKGDGAFVCWGDNHYDNLGNGSDPLGIFEATTWVP